MERYHQALMSEIDVFAKQHAGCSLYTLYIGGGTPSTWPDRLLLDMSGKIRSGFCLDQLQEVTIEVNPGTVRAEQVSLWRQCGINRLSIGVQYADPAVLAALNRFQSVKDVQYVLAIASKEFKNISVDIMLGLPGVDAESWYKFVSDVVTWPITHISLYCLMVHEHTPLYYKVECGDITLPDEGLVADLYCWSIEFLAKHGFMQYEVSNFARQGYESQHNTVYWDRKPYKGFGLGACSFDGSCRSMNEHNLMRYITVIEQGGATNVFMEQLSYEDGRLEKIMLGLRRTMGIRYELLMDGLSTSKQHAIKMKVQELSDAGLLRIDGDMLRLTTAGFVLEQKIIAELA
jgi:Coproporphyrinogen III oxidase and related Fe-S oxidoreductases